MALFCSAWMNMIRNFKKNVSSTTYEIPGHYSEYEKSATALYGDIEPIAIKPIFVHTSNQMRESQRDARGMETARHIEWLALGAKNNSFAVQLYTIEGEHCNHVFDEYEKALDCFNNWRE